MKEKIGHPFNRNDRKTLNKRVKSYLKMVKERSLVQILKFFIIQLKINRCLGVSIFLGILTRLGLTVDNLPVEDF